MSETFSMEAIEGDVGVATEATEGTSPISPDLSLFMLKGNTPNLEIIEDQKFERHAFNEKHPRGRDLIRFHTEGDGQGLLLAPGNGLPAMFRAALGVPWMSSLVHALTVSDGTVFKRNDLIFGFSSKARAEVIHVDFSTTPDTLWLVDVQGTFTQNEKIYFDTPAATDSTATASAASAAVAGYYAHRMDAVKYQQNKGLVAASTVATFACITDASVDFRKLQTTSGRRRVKVVLKDAATCPVPLEGWLGEAIMAVKYKTETGTFHVGDDLSAQTGAGDPRVIGTIVALVDDGTTGWIYSTVAATATPIADADVLTDDNVSPGAAVADCTVNNANLYNACKVYRYNESTDTTMTWGGDIATFDETDTLTYKATQKIFDQLSLSYYVKHAGDLAMVGNGMHIKDLTINANNTDYTYQTTLVGRTLAYPTTRPAFPAGLTTRAPYGAGSRTLELDGSLTAPAASYVLNATFGITFDIAIDKGMTVDQHFPTWLQPNGWGATGTLEVQWRSNELMRESWGGASVSTPTPGAKITKRLFMLLESGEDAVTGYPHLLALGCMGTIDKATLSRNADGYAQPVTLEAVNLTDEDGDYNWAPLQVIIFDATASHLTCGA
jgi:hypothetical protein